MTNGTFVDAINDAFMVAMDKSPNVISYGLGINDPKRLFGTTKGLVEKFGPERVFDMPTAENAMTGVGIGAALEGFYVIMNHQRLDFFLLAMDQVVNSAAKWFFMFGGQDSVPITIRLVLGRGWGQGPTHSQNLQSWFAHISGLKVVMPSTVENAKTLLLASIFDRNPVIFLEHRWLHHQKGAYPIGDVRAELGKARVAQIGQDVTIVAMSYMTIEAINAAKILSRYGISCEIIDLLSIQPLDIETIFSSVKKTRRLIVTDTASAFCSVASEIVCQVSTELFSNLVAPPVRLACPDLPTPTSFSLTKGFYVETVDIVSAAFRLLNREIPTEFKFEESSTPHDVPGDWFKGPF